MRWFSQQLIAGLFGSKFIILDSDGSSDGFFDPHPDWRHAQRRI
jgi:hypothetical protein